MKGKHILLAMYLVSTITTFAYGNFNQCELNNSAVVFMCLLFMGSVITVSWVMQYYNNDIFD